MDEHFRPNRGTRVAITRRGTFATGVQLHPRIAGWREEEGEMGEGEEEGWEGREERGKE